MNRTTCAAIQSSFSAYLDGAVSGQQMQEISRHLEGFEDTSGGQRVDGCEACARELAAWRLTQNALGALGPAKAPADLGLRLRVAISQEKARRGSRLLDRLGLAWENMVRPFVLQASAGFAGAVALVGGIVLLLGMVAAPQEVLANDEPLGAVTAAHYLYSTTNPGPIVTAHDSVVVVVAAVDRTGRVYDFTIASGPQDQTVRTQVANQLLSRVYEPASAFGVPIRGSVIVTFSGISVRG
jgi:anti-sigma factor RsiW